MWGISVEWWILYAIILGIALVKAVVRIATDLNVRDPYRESLKQQLNLINYNITEIKQQLGGIARIINKKPYT